MVDITNKHKFVKAKISEYIVSQMLSYINIVMVYFVFLKQCYTGFGFKVSPWFWSEHALPVTVV